MLLRLWKKRLISAQRARYPVKDAWTDCPWVKWRSRSRAYHALAKGGELGEMEERAQRKSNTELVLMLPSASTGTQSWSKAAAFWAMKAATSDMDWPENKAVLVKDWS